MRRSKKIILLFSVCLIAGFCIAQRHQNEIKPDQYRAIHWDVENGLPPGGGNNVTTRDAMGFLWIGGTNTQLCRFDGTTFKKYFPGSQKRGSINAGSVYTFKEDSLHNIWMGTDRGLSRYDIKADTFTNFSPVLRSAFPQLQMAPFWASADEMFCIEPGALVTAFNIHTLKRRRLVQLSREVDMSVQWNTNKSIFDTASKSIWKISYYQSQSALLEQIFPDGKTKKYEWPRDERNFFHGHTAEDMQYDAARHSIWINTSDGLFEFSLTHNQFLQTSALREFTKQKDYERGVGIDIDHNGRIWFSTYLKGIFIYDPKTERVRPAFCDPELQKRTGKANLHIYCDAEGIIWTCNWEQQGIYELIPFCTVVKGYSANPREKNSLSSGLISTIIPGPQGKVWMGTADGINIFDPVTETFDVLREKDLPGLKGTAIIPICIDTLKHKAWVNAGSQKTPREYFNMSMYEMDLQTRRCKRIIFFDGPKQIDSFSVPPTLVRPYKGGIIFVDQRHGVFEVQDGSLVANIIIPFTNRGGVGAIELAEDRYLFLQGGGELPNFTFQNKNGKWTKTPHILDSLSWFCMIYDQKDRTYWVSLKNELIHYDHAFREIKIYGNEYGYADAITSMQFDGTGNLWFINSAKQLGRLNTVTGAITIFTETEGFHKQDYGWNPPLTRDVHGDLYAGNGWKLDTVEPQWGLHRIYPGKYADVNNIRVYFRSLNINQKPFPLSSDINNVEELALHYDENTIRIETGIINFYSTEKGKIRCRLEEKGKTAEWQHPMDNIIRYEGVSPGDYRLTVQASNASGEFIGPEKILMVTISPPFWQTWWFRITAVICTAALFYGVITWRLQQKFRLRLERSEKERQVAELQQQKTELEMQALRAQMNPHFIFNSLNSINRFILKKQGTEASEYLTKFSKLIRMILNSSANVAVSLAEDLEALRLYLELESLRFENRFNYKVECHPDVDADFIQVPPMLLQPFVENAIWHGLMNKEGYGHLWINIDQQESTIICTITDDGIGRKKAAELKQTSVKHKSMGMKITESRISIMQKENADGNSIEITDLVDAEGNPAGTEVVLKIPVIEQD